MSVESTFKIGRDLAKSGNEPEENRGLLLALKQEVEALRWFHQIDFGGGLISPGIVSLTHLQSAADIYFKEDITNKSVLDIGCWDGFNSVEAVRRYAGRVVATDYWVWHNHPWATRKTIELTRKHLAPSLEILEMDCADLTAETVGTFDLVLFCGVFYHLRNPFLILEKVAALAKETLIIETVLDASEHNRPAMIFYPKDELNGDGSNWWGPNQSCMEAMMRDVGFRHVDFIERPHFPARGIFRGRRT